MLDNIRWSLTVKFIKRPYANIMKIHIEESYMSFHGFGVNRAIFWQTTVRPYIGICTIVQRAQDWPGRCLEVQYQHGILFPFLSIQRKDVSQDLCTCDLEAESYHLVHSQSR